MIIEGEIPMDDLFTIKGSTLDWQSHLAEVVEIRDFLEHHYGDENATDRLIPFVSDAKWEVRAEVASAMASINDEAITSFLPLLDDVNKYVVSNASRAMERRNVYTKNRTKQERHESKLFRNIEKIRQEYGPEAARLAREDIENAYELTVGYAAHDIRGILSPIEDRLTRIEKLVEDELPSAKYIQFKKYLQFIRSRTDMLFRMIGDMQDLAKKTPVERMQENLQQLISSAVDQVKDAFEAKERDISKISFDISGIPETLTVSVSRLIILRAFHNLIKNAVESYMKTSDYAQEGVVEISATQKTGGVEIVIRDYGQGMSESYLKRIRMFLPRSTSKKKTGTGLGMAIAYAKIKDHGGTLDIYSAGEDQGVVATVFLPEKGDSL